MAGLPAAGLMRNNIYKLLLVLFVYLFVFSSHQLFYRCLQATEQKKSITNLKDMIEQGVPFGTEVKDPGGLIGFGKPKSDEERERIFLSYRHLKELNNDYIGWISIPGTNIDYPVLQNIYDPDYYLKRNFEKKSSVYGSIYLDSSCFIGSSHNYVIYGHHMRDGSMFSDLVNYQEEPYYEEHSAIRFDSLYEIGDYEITAVLTIPGSKLGELSKLVLSKNITEFEALMEFINTYKLYDTGVVCEYEDQLLTLMTCEYTYSNGRIIIVAKKIIQPT